jgi:transcription elongation factor GreA
MEGTAAGGTLVILQPMIDEIVRKLESEVERLQDELTRDLPKRIRAAAELGDLRENSEYKSALERQQFVQARLNHLTSRLRELSNIDLSSIPRDRVGFGSWLKVRDVATGIEHEYTIVTGDFIDLDAGHISLASPLARGLLGARQGEEVDVDLPAGRRRFLILELRTLPSMLD